MWARMTALQMGSVPLVELFEAFGVVACPVVVVAVAAGVAVMLGVAVMITVGVTTAAVIVVAVVGWAVGVPDGAPIGTMVTGTW